jgi:hypothetical protein
MMTREERGRLLYDAYTRWIAREYRLPSELLVERRWGALPANEQQCWITIAEELWLMFKREAEMEGTKQ